MGGPIAVPAKVLASGTSTTVVTGSTSAGPQEPLAGGASVTTVTDKQDAEALRTMFHGSSHSEFNNGQFNNVGRDNKTSIVYHIHGNATVCCSSTDLVASHITSTGSTKMVLQDSMPSQLEPEHVDHQYTGAGSTLLTSTAEESGSITDIQTGITTPHEVRRDASTCEDQRSRSCPCTQGKEDHQATPTVDQTTKSG
ncbi:hypothetical protein K435DRAFT_813452 [Dendrothele bispora CBS 962.96]|uniref:Uncharacterized protein n=1 Tax=Dendrothele bispora (strain CBS 962.96) TaxID=1314807 RepID=A0A4S8KMF0_DENBC|nr:hypothetical protein K435DRAFT_813452 [Dendrothele bispora CBS 962.96]